ncbi:hypothetical protein CEXT_312601 [Caerostris extrusa]|uniref:Secreted protein n=1 Tax=Caerostris extrusa TaxID=172846 RepID=A0AAV4TER3_CAEEX|nr:hypothetical protein CEXT_312601 [Caerostris extrusa]
MALIFTGLVVIGSGSVKTKPSCGENVSNFYFGIQAFDRTKLQAFKMIIKIIIYSIHFPTNEIVLRYNFFIFITSRIRTERPLFTVARTVGLAEDGSIIRKRKSSSQTKKKETKMKKGFQ